MGLDMYIYAKKAISEGDERTPLLASILKDQESYGDGGADGRETYYYLSGYDFYGPEKKAVYNKVVELFSAAEFVDPDTPSAMVYPKGGGFEVQFTVAYWRKANQVHHWFVENVQGGEDECNPFPASREQLLELRNEAAGVLAEETEEAALETLPPTPGFFFGSYSVDDWYWQDLRDTVKQIDRVLQMPEDWTFVYRSSW